MYDSSGTVGSGDQILTLSALLGATDIADDLINGRTDVNEPNAEGWATLQVAAWHGNLSAVKFLLENEADIRKRISDGSTAYDLAKECDHHKVADFIAKFVSKELLEKGGEALTRLSRKSPERTRR